MGRKNTGHISAHLLLLLFLVFPFSEKFKIEFNKFPPFLSEILVFRFLGESSTLIYEMSTDGDTTTITLSTAINLTFSNRSLSYLILSTPRDNTETVISFFFLIIEENTTLSRWQ